MALEEQARTATALLVRTTYFDPRDGWLEDSKAAVEDYFARSQGGDVSGFRLPRSPTLADIGAAISQTDQYLRYAPLLRAASWPFLHESDEALFALTGSQIQERQKQRIVSIEMRSPLSIVVQLPPEAIAGMAAGLLLLAERICTLGPRISRKRKKDLLEAAIYDSARSALIEGRADALALQLLGDPFPSSSRRPANIDFLDPEDADSSADDLERIRADELA